MLKRKNKLIRISAATDIGLRTQNQDNFVIYDKIITVDQDCSLCCMLEQECNKVYYACVCDGIGGGKNGREVSKLCCIEVEKYLKKKNLREENVIEEVMECIDYVQVKVNEYLKADEGGCTLALLVWVNDKYYSFSIGDSIIFRYSKVLKQVNECQTLKEHKEKTGRKSRIEKNDSHILINYVGRRLTEGSEMVNISIGRIKRRDKFVIISDGVIDMGKTELEKKIKDGEKAKSIIDIASKQPNADTCTMIIIEMP